MIEQATDKKSPGTRVKSVPAGVWNSMVLAGEAYRNAELNNQGEPPKKPIRSDRIKVKNDCGEFRKRGEILSLGSLATENATAESIILVGETPVRHKRFAVLRFSVDDQKIVEAQISGVTIAKVYINDEDHRFACVPDDDTYVLQSSWTGPVELLHVGGAVDEESDCVIEFVRHAVGVAKTPSGGIPGRSGDVCGSADCDLYWIKDDGTLTEAKNADDETIKVEVFNMFSEDVGGSAFIQFKDVHGIAAVDAEDCD
jgi:hypothetical protein